MSEAQTVDGIDHRGLARNGEAVAKEPQKVPMVLKAISEWTGVKREVKDNFTLLRGVGAAEGYLTTNPHFLARVLERGPLAFDEARKQGFDPTLRVLPESAPKPTAQGTFYVDLKSISVDSDGNIVYTPEVVNDIKPLENDPITTLVVEGPNTKEQLGFIEKMDFDNAVFAYKKLPQLQEAYQKLGFKIRENGTWSFPPPRLLKERLKEFREKDKTSGIYYPEIEIREEGEIASKNFNSAFVKQKYPVSGISFEWYIHDVSQAHFQALMVHGEPLMDLMSNFASAMQSFDSIVLPGFDGWKIKRPGITDLLKGKDKDDATGDILDDMTNDLIIGNPKKLEKEFDQVAYALRKAGRFGNLKLVTDILESGEAAEEDQITGRMLADKLNTLTRKRFAMAA